MATLSCRCPYCEQTFRTPLDAGDPVTCPGCRQQLVAQVADPQQHPLTRCLICPSKELFVRKDFPQHLGVAIVVSGFAMSIVTWYYHQILATFAILFATALVDVVLYLVMGDVLECYGCHAQYRGLPQTDAHGGFDLETHERHRQQQARLKQASPPRS